VNPDQVAARYDSRPGYRLVDYGRVGLPIYRVTVIALTLLRKSLDPIEEFILRTVNAGLSRTSDIAGLLGLNAHIVEGAIANLIRSEQLYTQQSEEETINVVLTEKGQNTVRDQEEVKPAEQSLPFTYDGLIRTPKWYGEMELLPPRELRERGIPEVRSIPARGPELHELNVRDVAAVMSLAMGPRESPRSLLRLRSIERRQSLFMEAIALAYRSGETGAIQIGFAIDGRLSEEHELAAARAGALDKMRIFRGLKMGGDEGILKDIVGKDIAAQLPEAELPEAIRVEAARARGELIKAEEDLAAIDSADYEAEAREAVERAKEALSLIDEKLAGARVRPLAVYEHPALLRAAVDGVTERLVIISPWIRRSVVTKEFLKSLEDAVKRGATVYIGHGLGDADQEEKAWDRDARSELEALSKEHEGLHVKRLGDTHAKILIKDHDFFVISSFNWLSFKGDPKRTFREEWGTYVGIRGLVDKFFEQMKTRFVGSDSSGEANK